MDQVKATEVQICIITPHYLGDSPAGYPEDEQAIYAAFAQVITELRAKHGKNLPVYLEFCPLSLPENQKIAAYWGFNNLPAAQVIARFEDGTIANYGLEKDLQDKFTGINWEAKDVRDYVEAVLYQRKPSETSILCQIFPPLCDLGAYIWIVAAAYTTFRAVASEKGARIAWGAAAGLSWQSFFAAGGFKKLGIGK
jgi:hypothetical protein